MSEMWGVRESLTKWFSEARFSTRSFRTRFSTSSCSGLLLSTVAGRIADRGRRVRGRSCERCFQTLRRTPEKRNRDFVAVASGGFSQRMLC